MTGEKTTLQLLIHFMNYTKKCGLLAEGRVLAFTMSKPSISGNSVLKQNLFSQIGNL
jgi:hypothetical protein